MPRKVNRALASNLLISTVAWWLESGKQYSAKQISSWFLDLAINGYVRVLGLQWQVKFFAVKLSQFFHQHIIQQ